MTTDDLIYIKEWIEDGHFDNGDYARIQRVLSELLTHYNYNQRVYTLTPEGKAAVAALKGPVQ